MNKNKYDSLPDDLKVLVDEAAAEVNAWQWEVSAKKDAEYLEEIKNAGMEVEAFDEAQKAAFKKATESAYEEFTAKGQGQELLEIVKKYAK